MPPPGTSLSAIRPALQTPAEMLAAGRPQDAAEALAAVVAETPTYAAAHVLLGVALDAAGRPDEALAAWHRAAFLVPRSPLVLRERQRLLDAARADAPARTEEPPVQTEEPPVHPDEPRLDHPEPGLQQPEPPPHPDDPPAIEMAPLDDFIFAGPPPDVAGGPDGFGPNGLDPDGFDFSAFALDEDDDWLAAPPADGPLPAPFADWSVPPDDTPPDPTPPTDPVSPADPDDAWAVFEDFLASPHAAPAPARADMLAPEGAPGAARPIADDWLVDVPPAAPVPPAPVPPEAPAPAVPAPADLTPPSAAVFAEAEADDTGTVADELDLLIASLETAPRIRPDPAFTGPAVRVAMADVDEMASETLARIYAAQHQYVQAALVYETLAAREPERAEALLGQAAEMRRRRP